MTLIGVNAPYLQGDYGHDLAPNARYPDWPVAFTPMRAYRPLIEAAELGMGAVRMWLCENGEGIVTDDGAIVGVHPALLEAIDVIQEAAALHGLRLYWSLLDGNSVAREGDPLTRSVLVDADQRSRFAERVVRPIAERLDPALTVGLEILNEPETTTAACMADSEEARPGVAPVPWSSIGATLREAVLAVSGRHLVTAGTMHVFLRDLWAAEPALTAVDVHVYHPSGGLPSRDDLATYVGDPALAALPLLGGECGVPKESGQPEALVNYVFNADRLEYAAAFLWQLEGDLVDPQRRRRPFTELASTLRHHLRARRR